MWQHVGEVAVYSALVIQVRSPFSAEMFAQCYVLRHAAERRQQQIVESRNDLRKIDNIFVREKGSNLVFF